MSSQEMQSEHAAGLSALMDGDAGADEAKALCEIWGTDDKVRRQWHAYHLIGDTLRSDELAQAPAHDRQFLNRFSARLALEPVVLAPQSESASKPDAAGARARRKRWATPMTVAAGFVLAAGSLLVLKDNGAWNQAGAERQLAQNLPQTTVTAPTSTAEVAVTARTPAVMTASAGMNSQQTGGAKASQATSYPANGRLLRDARLERYLQAHKEFAAGTGLGLSTGYLRNASFDALQP